ncbi:dimethylaniline monooxygenase [N-oxide-forming] 2 [Parasteatoda tepidariorum]|uniref:dimethylaniline monooxygenase [N-oxide-forming] 2 n=1 Tax=Parasteatoda tepidariorum TaxID=114398 RepID=UPI001C723AE1|nr:dimethylaniline monooxygenase [N-oxide-forming] 2 [Parasteatoda tepidariorum]XP_042895038.1 dimethylaniline monooxygenase [N-oxide-forming] 2 [Parasteatoda tepidariorum]
MVSLPKKRIAIVGGGFCGITQTIMLKEENMEPYCFEKTDQPGGTWYYREESTTGVPSIMPTTIINHSKEYGAFSNFPPPKELPNYMKHRQIFNYFMSYANKNDALKHVQCNSEVLEVKRAADYEETGRWSVSVKNTISGEVIVDTYDGVVICVGHINIPKWPSYEDQDKFKGKIIHTHSLKGVAEYANKNVVVVGMGCSALDAAVEISNVANQVYLSTRSGAHVLTRAGPHGLPIDYVLFRRYITFLLDILPTNLCSWLLECFFLDLKFNSRLYAVAPEFHILSKDPVFNDHLASKLISGSIIQKREISKFAENGVIFEGETSITEADAVIMGTGYTWKFPFLEKDIRTDLEDQINLYKCIWPPNLEHSTMAFAGYILPFGPGFPLGELQCRWIAQVFAGNVKLPSKKEMLDDITKRNEANERRYGPSDKQSIRVDYVQYEDEIAEQIGAKPNLWKILFTDPKLWRKLLFGPCVSYQFRLKGPHPWEGAREAIMKCDERVFYPLKGKELERVESSFVLYGKKFVYFLFPMS